MAYCMLGIFDINMPLLYGEGPKAFLRLQHEILRTYHDYTIFAWTWMPSTGGESTQDFGVLAPSPKAFSRSDVTASALGGDQDKAPYTITNLGLSIRLPVLRAANNKLLAILPCSHGKVGEGHSLVLSLDSADGPGSTLSRTAHPSGPLRFCRHLPRPLPSDLFLRILPNRSSFGFGAGAYRDETLPSPASPTTVPRYGVFVVLNAESPWRVSAHPRSSYYSSGLFTFPPHPSAWKTLLSDEDKAGCSIHVRTTAMVVCLPVTNAGCEVLPARLSLFFTLSVVTLMKAGMARGQSRELERWENQLRFYEKGSAVVFGPGIQLPRGSHPTPVRRSFFDPFNTDDDDVESEMERATTHHQEWLQSDGPRTYVDEEMKWIMKHATTGPSNVNPPGSDDLIKMAQDRHRQERGNKSVVVGCCDAGYPGFEDLRMVWVDVKRTLGYRGGVSRIPEAVQDDKDDSKVTENVDVERADEGDPALELGLALGGDNTQSAQRVGEGLAARRASV